MDGALDGVRVLDFTHALNGPFATMLLGHLGAEVIKIEPPEGDNLRHSSMPPGSREDGYEFLVVNTNKKSVVLSLETEQGRELARRLIAISDVLVENYPKGTIEGFGLDYESIRSINPRLIYASAGDCWDSGPYAWYGSNPGVNNSMAGWIKEIGDETGGISLAVGILGALYARAQTGEGQKVEVAMHEALLGFMVGTMHAHFSGRFAAYKVGSERGATQVADGYFTLRAPDITDENYRKLAVTMGREDLVDAPGFAKAPDRRKNLKALDEIVLEWARGQTRQDLWVKLRDLGYFGAPVLSFAEVLEDPHIKAREAFVQREHPVAGPITLLAPWIRLSKTPSAIRQVAPVLGQDTEEVMEGILRLTPSEIEDLRARSVIA